MELIDTRDIKTTTKNNMETKLDTYMENTYYNQNLKIYLEEK